MKVNLVVTDEDVRMYICAILSEKHNIYIDPSHINIKVRSKQNYKSQEWESGEFKFEHSVSL